MDSPEMKARIRAHLARANLEIEETIGTLVHQMRFDIAEFFPDDELLQRAKRRGISHLIKKIKRRPVVAGFDEDMKPIFAYELEIEGYSAQEAAKHLTKVFGQEKRPPPRETAKLDFNEAVERTMEDAKLCGIKLSDEKLRKAIIKRLKPLFPGVVPDDSDKG